MSSIQTASPQGGMYWQSGQTPTAGANAGAPAFPQTTAPSYPAPNETDQPQTAPTPLPDLYGDDGQTQAQPLPSTGTAGANEWPAGQASTSSSPAQGAGGNVWGSGPAEQPATKDGNVWGAGDGSGATPTSQSGNTW